MVTGAIESATSTRAELETLFTIHTGSATNAATRRCNQRPSIDSLARVTDIEGDGLAGGREVAKITGRLGVSVDVASVQTLLEDKDLQRRIGIREPSGSETTRGTT